MGLTNQEKIYLTHQMNWLSNEPELAAIRYRAVNWVDARLEENILADHQLTRKQWEDFLSGRDPEFKNVKQRLLDNFHFSQEVQKELSLLEKSDLPLAQRQAAIAARMKAYIMKKERVAFRERAGITATAWQRFMNVSGYTSDDVVEQITKGLSLTQEEAKAFRKLVFHDTFSTENIKEYVRELIKGKNPSIENFLLNAEISDNAWEPFRTNSKGLPTSQATLLKIILGLKMDRMGGRDLLGRVNSDFVMRRDLVVLICIGSGIYEPEKCYYILEFFAANPGSRPYYRNLFKKI